MRFSKIVFWVAGIWGLLVITPLFFASSERFVGDLWLSAGVD